MAPCVQGLARVPQTLRRSPCAAAQHDRCPESSRTEYNLCGQLSMLLAMRFLPGKLTAPNQQPFHSQNTHIKGAYCTPPYAYRMVGRPGFEPGTKSL